MDKPCLRIVGFLLGSNAIPANSWFSQNENAFGENVVQMQRQAESGHPLWSISGSQWMPRFAFALTRPPPFAIFWFSWNPWDFIRIASKSIKCSTGGGPVFNDSQQFPTKGATWNGAKHAYSQTMLDVLWPPWRPQKITKSHLGLLYAVHFAKRRFPNVV